MDQLKDSTKAALNRVAEPHGASLLGVDNTNPIGSFLPVLLISILFGLAMDYEVFLVSRIRES